MNAPETADDLLAARLDERRDRIAYVQGGRALSRGQLDDDANRLAALLRRLDVAHGAPVPIVLNKSLEFVTAIFGVLKSGAMFVPFDVYDAPERIRYILDDLAAPVVITDERHLPLVEPHRRAREGLRVVLARDEAGADAPRPALRFEAPDGGPAAPDDAGPPPRSHGPGSRAYTIYTSGSTGRPKGVVVRHESLVNYVRETVRLLEFGEGTRIMCVKSFSFDASLTDIFCPLYSGGLVRLVDQKHITPRLLDRGVREHRLTHLSCTPSVLKLLVGFSDLRPDDFASLESITFGGEAISAAVLRVLQEKLPHVRLFNRYGPTEATVVAATYEVTEPLAPDDVIPLGKPHPGVSLFAFDDDGAPLREGGRGELLIGGVQLMQGYWNDPAMTARAMGFDARAGMTLYRTGDLVTVDARGNYVYLGRLDQTIKKYGFRINLHEIENALKAVAGVGDCVCVFVTRGEEQLIVAYVRAEGASARDLKAALSGRLPSYMVPDLFEVVADLPVTSSGKPDRDRLKAAFLAGGGP
ncbi:MAG TPA: amino acid adenylation domain-containing protein [Polyangiaceae bacterium]|nr:amino acid adenylation domain-containing protein [Polyangiaceae bacterium]